MKNPMFRLQGFVDKKNVADLMILLHGKIYNLEIVPVVNAAKKNGKLREEHGGSQRDQLFAKLPDKFDNKTAADALESVGGLRQSVYAVLSSLQKEKKIRKLANGKFVKVSAKK